MRESDICVFECERGDFFSDEGTGAALEQKLDGRTDRRATKRTKEGDAVSR